MIWASHDPCLPRASFPSRASTCQFSAVPVHILLYPSSSSRCHLFTPFPSVKQEEDLYHHVTLTWLNCVVRFDIHHPILFVFPQFTPGATTFVTRSRKPDGDYLKHFTHSTRITSQRLHRTPATFTTIDICRFGAFTTIFKAYRRLLAVLDLDLPAGWFIWAFWSKQTSNQRSTPLSQKRRPLKFSYDL